MKKTRVWIYCRVGHDTDNDALKKQEDLLRQAADPETHKIVGTTCEYDSSCRINRPGLQAVLEEAGKRNIDEVWITQIDRISRNYIQLREWIKNVVNCGVSICIYSGNGLMTSILQENHLLSTLSRAIEQQVHQ